MQKTSTTTNTHDTVVMSPSKLFFLFFYLFYYQLDTFNSKDFYRLPSFNVFLVLCFSRPVFFVYINNSGRVQSSLHFALSAKQSFNTADYFTLKGLESYVNNYSKKNGTYHYHCYNNCNGDP